MEAKLRDLKERRNAKISPMIKIKGMPLLTQIW